MGLFAAWQLRTFMSNLITPGDYGNCTDQRYYLIVSIPCEKDDATRGQNFEFIGAAHIVVLE